MASVQTVGEVEAEAAEFQRTLRDLVRLQSHRERERAACYGVTVSGAHALEVLAALGPVSLNRLAAELFVDKSTASRVVGALEDRALLRRAPDPADGRALRLELTAAGTALHAQLREDAVWEAQALLAGFAPDARRGMLRFLRQLTRTSATHAGATAASCCLPDPDPEG